jgi:protein-disulfide isomerase
MLANSQVERYNKNMEQETNNNEQIPEVLVPKEEPISAVEETPLKTESGSKLTMPMALVLAGVIIAIAIIITGGNDGAKFKKSANGTMQIKDYTQERELKQITKDEHILGDLNKAKVAVVEFSDFQCPYCKAMHPNLVKMMQVYKEDVVWVYRQFPLESIHPHARPAAIASECVAELGGNDAFWKFTDGIFNFSGTGTAFDDANFTKIITDTGVDTAKVGECLTSGKYDKFIDQAVEDAQKAGAQGTPDLTAVNLKTGEAVHIGADPNLLGQVLDQMIGK